MLFYTGKIQTLFIIQDHFLSKNYSIIHLSHQNKAINMKKLLAIPLFLLLAGCNSSTATESATKPTTEPTKTFLVDSQLYDCMGVAPMKCMKVKELPSGEWSLFYQNIEGFDYKTGTEYTLKVKVTDIPNPPADASSVKYTLIEVLDKK